MDSALAVIELAEACLMFEKIENYKATGVCYNNIANYQVHHGNFELAIQNYKKAIQ
jgi:hypothetical protein